MKVLKMGIHGPTWATLKDPNHKVNGLLMLLSGKATISYAKGSVLVRIFPDSAFDPVFKPQVEPAPLFEMRVQKL